MQNFIIC